MDAIVEWAPFNLREGSRETALLEASEAMEREFLSRQSGYLRRELLRGDGAGYVDLVWWASLAQAKAAAANAHASDACATYFSHMEAGQDEAGSGILHFRAIRTYFPDGDGAAGQRQARRKSA